jgi:hypothetical protein
MAANSGRHATRCYFGVDDVDVVLAAVESEDSKSGYTLRPETRAERSGA